MFDMENEIAKISKGCGAGLGRIIGVIFLPTEPVIDESKTLEPITEDAEFEVIEKKTLELPTSSNA